MAWVCIVIARSMATKQSRAAAYRAGLLRCARNDTGCVGWHRDPIRMIGPPRGFAGAGSARTHAGPARLERSNIGGRGAAVAAAGTCGGPGRCGAGLRMRGDSRRRSATPVPLLAALPVAMRAGEEGLQTEPAQATVCRDCDAMMQRCAGVANIRTAAPDPDPPPGIAGSAASPCRAKEHGVGAEL